MRNRSKGAYWLLGSVAAISGCGLQQPVYSPPEQHVEAAQQCPMGRVLVCRDRYESVAAGEDEEQEFCMCQDLAKVR